MHSVLAGIGMKTTTKVGTLVEALGPKPEHNSQKRWLMWIWKVQLNMKMRIWERWLHHLHWHHHHHLLLHLQHPLHKPSQLSPSSMREEKPSVLCVRTSLCMENESAGWHVDASSTQVAGTSSKMQPCVTSRWAHRAQIVEEATILLLFGPILEQHQVSSFQMTSKWRTKTLDLSFRPAHPSTHSEGIALNPEGFALSLFNVREDLSRLEYKISRRKTVHYC